ncbi:hypothetical protein SAMN05443529_104109 [Desulfosporosinus hippei DSM 8344]|uniref:Uncharacterized protein n=1 Tax=Desulfosporosinus hippei DSM 8344 TaxID=1121419 RepID=A0A1G7VG45_9FIRM|nr:hypothetical protein SAMN05443529_104109 [Desulfosporosinus hippei DSM 8344]
MERKALGLGISLRRRGLKTVDTVIGKKRIFKNVVSERRAGSENDRLAQVGAKLKGTVADTGYIGGNAHFRKTVAA